MQNYTGWQIDLAQLHVDKHLIAIRIRILH
jgi:hypothetical protein